jgi:hypothetical protein
VIEVIKKRTVALVTFGLLVAAAAVPSAASAYEWDIAKRGNPPSGMPCVDTSRAQVCFQSYGDKVWVQDEKRDGRSALGQWDVDGRYGFCRNRSKYDNWARCNKNFPEGVTVKFAAGTYNKSGPGPNDHIYYDEFSRFESTGTS